MKKKRSNAINVNQCWLYAISSPEDLARRLSTSLISFTIDDLVKLSKDESNYRTFPVKNEDGKSRLVQEPKPRLQKIHSRIGFLLSRIQVPDYLHSGIRGRSYVTNAASHPMGLPAVKIDIKKFYTSVLKVKVYHLFLDVFKCRADVAGLISDLLTYNGHLPTGSASSLIVAYYSYKNMFDELDALARHHDLTMSCYVDDLTFTGIKANKHFLSKVRLLIATHGLKSHKTHSFRGEQPRVITGVCNTQSGCRVPNKLHLKITNGFNQLEIAEDLSQKDSILKTLLGRLHAAGQIEPKFKAAIPRLQDKFGKN